MDCFNKLWRNFARCFAETLAQQPEPPPLRATSGYKCKVDEAWLGVQRLVMILACLPDPRSSFAEQRGSGLRLH